MDETGRNKKQKKTDKKRSDRKHGVPKGLSLNTISTYMRTLKAVYNRLADKKILPYNPKLFDNVYTKVESQTKRALGYKTNEYTTAHRYRKIAQRDAMCIGIFLTNVSIPGNAIH